MNKLTNLFALVLALGVSTAFAADEVPAPAAPAAPAVQYKTPKLSRAQLDELLAKPSQLLVIDLRRPDELTKIGGLPVYLSIQSDDLEKRLDYISKDRKIITVSNHAGRALKAGDYLDSKGYKVVGAVGVQNYEEEGGTLTKIVPPAPKVADASKPAQ